MHSLVRIGIVVLLGTAMLSAQTLPPPTFKLPLPNGWFGQRPDTMNEVAVVSENEDPPMVWMVSPAGNSLGALTFGRVRPDGRFEAMVLIQGKQDERTRHLPPPYAYTGELTIHIRNGALGGMDDGQFIKVVEARHDYAILWGQCVGACPVEALSRDRSPRPERMDVLRERPH